MRTSALVIASLFVVASCSGSDDAADPSEESTTTSPADSPSTTSEMRPVPTVPPSTIEGQAVDDDAGDGVVEVAPTVAPPPVTVDPDAAPGETVAPPSTDLVGDPQPSPETTAPPPPETVAPPPPACDRLDAVGVPAEIEGFIQPIDTVEAFVDPDGCRYVAGEFVVEIWFVPLDEVRNDWFERVGVEPVAEAGGEAVGLDGSRGPDGSSGAGYTVAVAGGGQGVIVSVADFAGADLTAGFVAALAAQAG